jgi:uncharacterized protein HemX
MTDDRPDETTAAEPSEPFLRQKSPLPTQETQQPDPMMQISTGRAGPVSLSLAALAVAAILGLVFYGLNDGGTNERTAAPTPAPAPAQSAQPAAGGKGGAATPGAPRTNESGVKG